MNKSLDRRFWDYRRIGLASYCDVEKRLELFVDPEFHLKTLLDERHLMVRIFGGEVFFALVNLVLEHVSKLDAIVLMMLMLLLSIVVVGTAILSINGG